MTFELSNESEDLRDCVTISDCDFVFISPEGQREFFEEKELRICFEHVTAMFIGRMAASLVES